MPSEKSKRGEDTPFRTSGAAVSPRLHPTSALKIADIGSNSLRRRRVERPAVRSAVTVIDAARRLRGDAVETVMQTANFRNRHDATG